MNKKPGIGLAIVVICAIVTVAMFTGCIEEETATPALKVTPTQPLETDSDNATIEKRPWMKAVFQNQAFSFQLHRTLGYTYYGGADVEECLSTACRIKDGDFTSAYL